MRRRHALPAAIAVTALLSLSALPALGSAAGADPAATPIPLGTQCVAGLTPMSQLSSEGVAANDLELELSVDHELVTPIDAYTATEHQEEAWKNNGTRTVRNARLFIGSVGIASALATTWPNGWTYETWKSGNDQQATLVAGDPSYLPGATGLDPAFSGFYVRMGTPAQYPNAAPIQWETFAQDGIDVTGEDASGGGGDPSSVNDSDAIGPAMVYGDIPAGATSAALDWYAIIDVPQNLGFGWEFDSRIAGQYDCPAITAGPADSGTVGTAYDSAVAATLVGGGVITYQLADGDVLPDGLTIDPASGQITGTPTAPGATTFRVDAVDAFGDYDVQSYTITVDPLAVETTTPTAPDSTAPDSSSPASATPDSSSPQTSTATASSGSANLASTGVQAQPLIVLAVSLLVIGVAILLLGIRSRSVRRR